MFVYSSEHMLYVIFNQYVDIDPSWSWLYVVFIMQKGKVQVEWELSGELGLLPTCNTVPGRRRVSGEDSEEQEEREVFHFTHDVSRRLENISAAELSLTSKSHQYILLILLNVNMFCDTSC